MLYLLQKIRNVSTSDSFDKNMASLNVVIVVEIIQALQNLALTKSIGSYNSTVDDQKVLIY